MIVKIRIIIIFTFSCLGLLCSYSQNVIPIRDYQVQIENEAVHQYMQNVVYNPHDESLIDNYRQGLTYRVDWPNPVIIDIPQSTTDSLYIYCCDDKTLQDSLKFRISTTNHTAELYNFIPNRVYRYQIKNGDEVLQQGKIETSGQVRMINVCNTVSNVRDLGGWKTADNKKIRYGKLFRGSDLNGTHIATIEGIELLRELGIGAELDLRGDYNKSHNISAFGFMNFSDDGIPTYYYSSSSGQLPSQMNNDTYLTKWKKEFKFIVNNLRQGRAIYEHCVWGKDRTGLLSFLLEGLLGVSYSDLAKEYELSFLYYNTISTKDSIDKAFDFIETMEGETLRDKFYTYFVSKIQVEQDDIVFFRSEMLEAAENDNAIRDTEIDLYNINKDRIYDLSGRTVTTPKSGRIYLIRDKYGHTHKIVYQ